MLSRSAKLSQETPDFKTIDAGEARSHRAPLNPSTGFAFANEMVGTRLNALGSVKGIETPRGVVQLLLGADSQLTPPPTTMGPLMWRSRITGNLPGGTTAVVEKGSVRADRQYAESEPVAAEPTS